MDGVTAEHRDKGEQEQPEEEDDFEDADPEFYISVTKPLLTVSSHIDSPTSPYTRTLTPLAAASATSPAEMTIAGLSDSAQYSTRTLSAVSSKQTKAIPWMT